MKKYFIVLGTILLLIFIFTSAILIPRSDINKANAIISSDYSTIKYKGNVYVPISLEKIPLEVRNITMMTTNNMIKATVENENYFLDKYFFTNYIAVEEYDGEIFIYLHTDYDVNESDYYCSKNYKEKNSE